MASHFSRGVSPTNAATAQGHPNPHHLPTEAERNFIIHIEHYLGLLVGWDAEGQKPYVSTEVLYEYWTLGRVGAVCTSYGQRISWSLIRSNYIRVFSTLVYAGFSHMIEYFIRFHLDDHHFPCDSLPLRISESRLFENCRQAFQANQWKFFPLELPFRIMHDCVIPSRRIVPFTSKEEISGHKNDSACIYKVKLDPGCNGVEEHRVSSLTPTPMSFVLKSYQSSYPGTRQAYEREVSFYTALENTKASDSFLKSYGQYEQSGTMNILLEYMNLGSLSDYMRTHSPPELPTEIIDLWESQLEVLAALAQLHAKRTSNENNEDTYVIFHRDIGPDNILLSRTEDNTIRAVIGDPGCSEIFLSNRRDGSGPRQAEYQIFATGNQMYCAPEACRQDANVRNLDVTITSRSDVYSLGAVWSELAIWTICGYEGVEEYQRKRVDEHQNFPNHVDTGHEGCFHDRSRALKAVKDTHSHVLQKACGAGHRATEGIIQLIQNYMLCPEPQERQEALELLESLRYILRDARASLDSSKAANPRIPPTPRSSTGLVNPTDELGLLQNSQNSLSRNTPRNSAHRISGPLSSPLPKTTVSPPRQRTQSMHRYLSISQVLRWREDEKSRTSGTPAYVQSTINELCSNFKDRDHSFFIIDSHSLGQYYRELDDAFTALSYLAKKMDDDGIELFYASSGRTSRPKKSKNTASLIKDLKNHKYSFDPKQAEASLERLFTKHIIPRLKNPEGKPQSLYIFTDGVWGDDNRSDHAYNVDRPVRDLIKSLEKFTGGRTHVMLQFIRFGDDPHGAAALQHLDDFEKKWDICDTTPAHGNVYKMFYGSINREIDEDFANTEEMVASPASSNFESHHQQRAYSALDGRG